MSAFEFGEEEMVFRDGAGRRGSLAPILIAGIIALVALAASTPLGAWLRGFFSRRRRDRRPRQLIGGGHPLWAIRDSILGRRKAAVAAVLGPPRTAVLTAGPARVGERPVFWFADVWYYAVDDRTETAMAVKFVGNIAREVDFFDAPGAGPPSAGG